VLLGLPSFAPQAFAQSRDPLARLATVRIGGIECVDLRAVAQSLGWRVRSASESAVVLASGETLARFSAGERDFTVAGIRFFSGDGLRPHKRSLWVSRVDATSAIRPLLLPAAGAPLAPVRTICIDPGHGGKDPGTMNLRLGLKEKTYVLDLGLRLQRIFQAAGYRVVMTRTTDVFLSLESRAALSNRAKADCFLSLHFNATQSESVNGAEMFILTPQFQRSTSSASASASDRTALPGNRHDARNTSLGFAVHRRIVRTLARPDRGIRRARFAVLRPVDCPAILVEGGYLSNMAEARAIQSADFRARLAEQIARGVADWAGSRA
jgi:N-acetylmuramoyl-L-alanine amidase